MSKMGNHIQDLEDKGQAPYQNLALDYANQFATEAQQELVDRIRRRKVSQLRAKMAEHKAQRKVQK